MAEAKWYAMKAISGKEQKVKEYIEAACKTTDLGNYVSQVIVPMEKVVQLRNGKRVTKEKVRLPGYVLVECALINECYPKLRNVPNVLGFLSESKASTTPLPIRQNELNLFLGTMQESQAVDEEEYSFIVGEKVKVTDGPFSGMNGEIVEIFPEKKKLSVEIIVFGRPTPMELAFNQVDKE